MKIFKLILPVVLLAISTHTVLAQRYKQQRYGQFSAGFSDIGFMVSGSYVYNFQSNISGQGTAGFTSGKIKDLTVSTAFVDGLGSFSIYENRNLYYFNIVGGLTMGVDFVSDFKSDRLEKNQFFTYGLVAGVESEFKILRSVSFVLFGTQRYHLKETFDDKTRWRFQAGLGIRYAL